jgi:uncharacterized protein (TIGR02117 family)
MGYLLSGSCNLKICISNNRFHTNIIVPVQNEIFDWRNHLTLNNVAQADNSDYRYLSFGWGERAWYINTPTQVDLKLRMGFRALFFPNNASVLRVQKHYSFPQAYEIECVGVSRADYLELMDFIKNSFRLSAQGEKIRVAYNPYLRASFYEAKGSYSIVNNSNSWTGEGLRIANVNTPLWSGLSSAIMHHLHETC